MMKNVTGVKRRATFRCIAALALPEGKVRGVEGRIVGRIVSQLVGAKGFGYDPLFRPDGSDRTFGEMSAEEKHGLPPQGQGLSHRARAFIKLADACLSKT